MAVPLRVLIVEDLEDDAILLIEGLRMGGFDPSYLRVDSAEGMRLALARQSWDFVLADFALPHFSGPAALAVLREGGYDTPFIVVSGTVSEEQAIEMMRNGANDFVLKQNIGRLLPAIRRELREAEVRRQRRKAEQQLWESRQRLQFVLENSPDSIFIQDTDLRYLWVTRTTLPLSPEEYLGKTDADIFSEEDARRINEIKRVVMTEGKGTTVELPITIKGVNGVFDATFEPWRNVEGEVIGIAGYVRDITERKRAEEALIRERAFLSSAIDLLPFPIVFSTTAGAVLRANHASYRFFGSTDASDWWHAELLTADTHLPVPTELWPMARSAHGEVVPATEAIFKLTDGREVPVLGYSAPVVIGDEIVATVVAFQDISALKEADRAKNQFLALLSHELRTPLTNILGWIEEAQLSPEILTEALKIIRRNAESQRRMLENLLEVSRLIHGKLTLRHENTDLWQVTQQAVKGVQARADERRITMQLSPPEQPLPIYADRKLLIESVDNLLDNALRFTDPEGQVTISGRREDKWAVLEIRDTGRGFPPSMLPHLFDLFKVSAETEVSGGLGLGLPLVKAVAELHQGRISAISPGLDQGSTFTLRLPLTE